MHLKPLLCVLLLLAFPLQISATIAIPGSRVVYEEAQGEERIALQQTGAVPGVVQVWLDAGEDNAVPENIHAPFILAPGAARIDPGHEQVVQIQRISEDLPQDRESLFWLNILEIPLLPSPQAHHAGAEYQPATEGFRARIKFFYRPRSLSASFALAHQSLQFSLLPSVPDDRIQIRVTNPTPYHITFIELALHEADGTPALATFAPDRPDTRMVEPLGELILSLDKTPALQKPVHASPEAVVRFSIINDSGGQAFGQQMLDIGMAME